MGKMIAKNIFCIMIVLQENNGPLAQLVEQYFCKVKVRSSTLLGSTVMKKDFTEMVREIVSKIPKGKTMTYAMVAKMAGSKGAARAVGSIMAANYDPKIPCHRVIRSDGKLGEYNRGGTKAKRALLIKEGAIKG